jgi:hypothetical protein
MAGIAACFAAAGLASAADPAAAEIQEVRLAQAKSPAAVLSVTAGYGVVAWVEAREAKGRVAVRYRGHTRRTAWSGSGSLEVSVARRVDQRTGRVAVRVVVCRTRPNCKPELLSPRSLRRTASVFAPDPVSSYAGPRYALDGDAQLATATVLDAVQPADRSYTHLMPASSCSFTLLPESARALPSIPDCATAAPSLRGRILAVESDVPSRTQDDHFSTTRALHALDLDRVAEGWKRLVVGGYGKGGSIGVQSMCVLDHAVVVLSGYDDDYSIADHEDWNLTLYPIGAKSAGWSEPVPSLTPDDDGSGSGLLACSGSSIYASYSMDGGTKKHPTTITRVVRLVHHY